MNELLIERDISHRLDMRDELTFTVDPEDAKDFDDALSFSVLGENRYRVGVHIADVSFFVKEGSKIDREAYEKATSVYLVDRVIPMLPNRLCNDLCSLMEGKDRLCLSVLFTINEEFKIIKTSVAQTVIRSDNRLTYEEAQQIIDGSAIFSDKLTFAVHKLWEMADSFRQHRIVEGALMIEQEEVRFVLDKKKNPVRIFLKTPKEANYLIEEWMLMANRSIAYMMRSQPFIYRVHDVPEEDKLRHLQDFTKFFSRSNDSFHDKLVSLMTVRAMAKAVYSPKNIGHYGLAFKYYTHFTSPIRRYPDLMVHRMVRTRLIEHAVYNIDRVGLKNICDHCSLREQEAQIAERESLKEMQLRFLKKHRDDQFLGHIVSVMEYGFFVRLDSNLCEGLVHIRQLFDIDRFIFLPEQYRLRGENSNIVFTLGDRVTVQIEKLNFEKNQVDFRLILPKKYCPYDRRTRK